MALVQTFIVNLPKLLPAAGIESMETTKVIAEKFRRLRLQALAVDPEAFATSYEQATREDLSHSLERLKNPIVDCFFVVDRPVMADAAQLPEQVWQNLSKAEFLGMIVLNGPVAQSKSMSASRDAPVSRTGKRTREAIAEDKGASTTELEPFLLEYSLHGTFVAPECRKQGINAALEKAQAEAARCGGNLRCSVLVDAQNEAARKAYEKAGFVMTGEEQYMQQPRAQRGKMVAEERTALRMEIEGERG